MHLLIIGGSDAGISAALRAQELAPGTEITVLLADDYPNFSICGLPYYLSGETPDWRALAHRNEFPGIHLLRGHTARQIDPVHKTVLVEIAAETKCLRYDRLVIATGSLPVRPELSGSDLDGVFSLHSMQDSFRVDHHLTQHAPRSAVLVGGGYIGLELADAFTQRGIAVILLSRSETVLPTVDAALGRQVQEELERHGVRVLTGVQATQIERARPGAASQLILRDSTAVVHEADLVVLAVGARPDSELAYTAGARLGVRGAIVVTREMRTTLPDVFAAGDCVETYHRLLRTPTYLSLGTIAHKQGRVAGENAVGGEREFAGCVSTQSLKVFDLAIARTGLLESEARLAGFEPLTVATTANDHKAYYPGAVPLSIHMMGDRATSRLLGAQILGHRKAEISKRIDIVAAALFQDSQIETLNDLDLSYTPPFSSPWDPVQIAAQLWQKNARGGDFV